MQNSSDAEGGDHAWAQSLIDNYWIPNHTDPKDVGKLLRNVIKSFTSDEDLPLKQALEVLTENVESVQQFLSFPYALAKGLLNEAKIPNQKEGDADFRLRLVAKTMTSATVAEQLHRMKQQAVILLWSAYETFSRDIFIAVLNGQPKLYNKLIKSSLKDKFNSSQIFSFSGLEKYDFTLEGKLGIAIADGKDFSSPGLLRSLFTLLLPSGEFMQQMSIALESQDLWRLGHRRHLIAHRSGVIDENYLRQTGDNGQATGTQLIVQGWEIDKAMLEVANAAMLILLSAAKQEKTQHMSIEVDSPIPLSGP